MTANDYIEVVHRTLPYTTFDADNHMYENREAMTKFLAPGVPGRHQIRRDRRADETGDPGQDQRLHPQPHLLQGGRPRRRWIRRHQGGKGDGAASRAGFGKLVAMPGIDAFFDPEPRLELMKEMGIDRTLLWPTLASAVEERLAEDPDAVCAVIHALNDWMHEHWTYVYSDAIYSTPIISLAVLERAIEELEYIAERGAKIFLIRVAPVPTWKGRRSFALPEFDPFWERVQELGLVVGHALG